MDSQWLIANHSHGGFDDLLHHLLEPLLQQANPDIKLVVEGYDVGMYIRCTSLTRKVFTASSVGKREYLSQERLRDIDCVMSGFGCCQLDREDLLNNRQFLAPSLKMRVQIRLGYRDWLDM